MLSSPHPTPRLYAWKAAMVLGWLAGVAAGVWVIVSPSLSYEGLGLALTTLWGAMLALGSGLCVAAHLLRRYQVELPGLVLALGGVVIYGYLSWPATLTDSPGSGPRALLLVLFASWIVARALAILHIDRELRRMLDLEGDDG